MWRDHSRRRERGEKVKGCLTDLNASVSRLSWKWIKGVDLLQAIRSALRSGLRAALRKMCFPATVSLFHRFLTLKTSVTISVSHGDAY